VITYRARWVVPVTAPPIPHGAVTVDEGRITYVGAAAGAPRSATDDLGDVLLLPGLVNAHCHLELTAMRGFLEDLDFRRWIVRLTAARRDVLDRDALLDSARYGLEEGIRAGISAYGDTCASGVVLQAMREARVRGVMYQEVFGPDPAQCADALAGLRAAVDELRRDETPLARVGVSPHAPYTVSDDLFRQTAGFARAEGLPLAVHIAESEAERAYVTRGEGPFADALRARGIAVAPRGRSPIDVLDRAGVLAARPLLIHCVRVDARDIERIAGSRSAVAHCPASNAKLGAGTAPLMEMIGAGVAVGLGSDSMASNNRMDILDEARLALLAQRARAGSHHAPSASDVLALATIGGARALGIDGDAGSLTVGKSADLAAFAIDPCLPAHDPVAAAIYAATAARARFVAVAGVVLLRDGALAAPRDGLADRMRSLGESLRAWLAAGGETRLPAGNS
jgi:5-methylthioadenosine/S-adenosylhomocysteine deaminase